MSVQIHGMKSAVVLAGLFIVGPTQPAAAAAEQAGSQEAAVAAEKDSKTEDAALARTRRVAMMLDAIYKNAIVLITENYITGDESLAAGEAFKKVFEVTEKDGYATTRLIDATGEPYNEENTPRPGFEQRAVKALLAGQSTYEEIEKTDEGRILHFATAVPVVMEKCTMCHSHYEDVPAGKPIGSLTYSLKIE